MKQAGDYPAFVNLKKRIGVQKSQISRIESNASNVTIDTLIAGQDVFSEPVSVLRNIKGGLGIFSGINSVTDTIRFQ
jgi:transcriptional regulator with XRE-family HTH domain